MELEEVMLGTILPDDKDLDEGGGRKTAQAKTFFSYVS